MSELCSHFSSLVISDLYLLFSFILSHPLYFSYFIFFSPYILKLISFLSPLFITTFLIFLAFLSQTRLIAVFDQYQSEGFKGLEDLEMYEVLFGKDEILEEKSDGVLEYSVSDKEDCEKDEVFGDVRVEIVKNPVKLEMNSCVRVGEKKGLENFLKILEEFERMSSNVEEKKKVGTRTNKVVEKILSNGGSNVGTTKVGSNDGKDCNSMARISSNLDLDKDAATNKLGSNGEKDCNSMVRITSNLDLTKDDHKSFRELNDDHSNSYLGTYGSMRKEKEWKRTLACKLFEERHNVDGGEGMDSLWEAYETDSSDKQTNQKKTIGKNKTKTKTKTRTRRVEDEEEEEEIVGQLCCLQALNLSTRKMNLGMGRPNLVKISKAIKGIGWLHKTSKKVHNNGDKY